MPSIESLESPNLPGLIDMSPHMGDFMDTARIVKRLDLIVTVDTSMAHLAGSLGLPTIVLLQNPPDWRWGLGEYTPWYQTLALLRQTAHGDWAEVISLLKQRIIKLATFGKRDAPTYSGLTFRS
jgi:ADP-heptose:LPS heptosyltransferase